MPRRRVPDETHRLKGTFRPSRHGPIAPPEGAPLGKPPADWDPAVQAAWRELAAAGEGRLVSADGVLVELAARLLVKCRAPDAKAGDASNLLRALAALQLDPVHRREIAKPSALNEFDEF